MKSLILFLSILPFSAFAQIDGKYWLAGETLIKTLRKQSPKFEGVAIRDYSYQDLNFDQVYEITETVNSFEEKSPGFLNAELSPAFDLHRIYIYKNGRFEKNYKPFSNYLQERIEFYSFWKRQIENPSQLSEDSQALVQANKQLFLLELDRLIGLLRQLQS